MSQNDCERLPIHSVAEKRAYATEAVSQNE